MGAGKVYAQAPATAAQTPSPSIVFPARKNLNKERTQEHHFWDKKNDWLFAGVGAARTFDYFSTLELGGGVETGKSCLRMRSWTITRRLRRSRRRELVFRSGVVFIPSLRPSQTGTLDLDGAFRIGDVGRGAQLLPENGTSKDHSVAARPTERKRYLVHPV